MHPDFTRPTFAREIMKYSKSAPLDIEWECGYIRQNHLDMLLEAIEQPLRISSLDLRCHSSALTTLVSKAVHPAPSIHLLSLAINDGMFCVLPDLLLGGDAPRLTSFGTRGCSIPWGSPILANLTSFIIAQSCSLGTATPLKMIATALQAMTALEVLKMTDFVTSESNIRLSDDMKVVLPRLRNLKLSSRGMAVATLLQRMYFPNTAVIELEISPLDNAQDALANYLPGLFPIRRQIHIREPFGHSMLTAPPATLFDAEGGKTLSSIPRFQCWIGKEVWSEPLPIMRRLLGGLGPLASLETLSISCVDLCQNTLIQYFGNSPTLQRIDVQSDSQLALEVIKSLSHNLPRSSTTTRKPRKGQTQSARSKAIGTKAKKRSTTHPIVYPALDTLDVSDVDFSDIVDPLIDSLRSRSEHGSHTQVILQNCTNLYSADVQKNKDQVGVDIDWDGVETDGVDLEEEMEDYHYEENLYGGLYYDSDHSDLYW
ncbi:hypothetical protein V5O48_011827 [Marasmius crinis-equi]|uniref:Uncharacterized protein n=1 Tax=Marasmius crinis-equi TaxID=585013 RepID=A0ABR3F4Y1_9AGAR